MTYFTASDLVLTSQKSLRVKKKQGVFEILSIFIKDKSLQNGCTLLCFLRFCSLRGVLQSPRKVLSFRVNSKKKEKSLFEDHLL